MAVLSSRATVIATAVRLDIPETVTRWSITFVNRGTDPIFIGGAGVTTATGLELGVGERMSMMLRPTDGGVYAIAATGSQRVDRVQIGWS
jgi:hypothetical protein